MDRATARGWSVEGVAGRASHLHALDVPARRLVRVAEVTGPALVLGSSQPDADVDRALAARRGVEVARRRSGGGAVWLAPGEQLWVDIALPVGDALWLDDVNRSSHWLGAVWADALASLRPATGAPPSAAGDRGAPTVWRDRLSDAALGRVACFAGTGPGEVVIGDTKAVGISQRRTRVHARFQCVVPLVWDPSVWVDLLGPSGRSDDLARVWAGWSGPPTWVGVGRSGHDELLAAFLDRLP